MNVAGAWAQQDTGFVRHVASLVFVDGLHIVMRHARTGGRRRRPKAAESLPFRKLDPDIAGPAVLRQTRAAAHRAPRIVIRPVRWYALGCSEPGETPKTGKTPNNLDDSDMSGKRKSTFFGRKPGRPVSRLRQAVLALAPLVLGTPGLSGAQETFTLPELLEIGLERNPGLLSLRAEREAMDADRRDAGRLQNPEIEYRTGEGEPFDDPDTRSLREWGVSQTVPNFLSRHFRQSSLTREVEAAEEGIRAGALDVATEIRLHFYRILFLERLLDLARQNEQALDEVRGLIEVRASAGEVKELEAIRLRVEHMRARNEVTAASLELSQYRQHLNTYLGNALPDGYLLEGGLEADLTIPDLDRIEAEVLPGHPILQEAARHREGAGEQVKASRFSWIPDPVFSATSAKEMDGDVFKLGVGFEIPLWNQSRAATRRERETLRRLEYREEALRMELEANLLTHHNHLLLHRETLRLFEEGLLEEAEVSMQIAEVSYREGEISLVEYLDARRTHRSIQIEFQQALYDWNRELAELERAAGGGIL